MERWHLKHMVSTQGIFHHNFPDPAKAEGTESGVKERFRSVRDQIKSYCRDFVERYIKSPEALWLSAKNQMYYLRLTTCIIEGTRQDGWCKFHIFADMKASLLILFILLGSSAAVAHHARPAGTTPSFKKCTVFFKKLSTQHVSDYPDKESSGHISREAVRVLAILCQEKSSLTGLATEGFFISAVSLKKRNKPNIIQRALEEWNRPECPAHHFW